MHRGGLVTIKAGTGEEVSPCVEAHCHRGHTLRAWGESQSHPECANGGGKEHHENIPSHREGTGAQGHGQQATGWGHSFGPAGGQRCPRPGPTALCPWCLLRLLPSSGSPMRGAVRFPEVQEDGHGSCSSPQTSCTERCGAGGGRCSWRARGGQLHTHHPEEPPRSDRRGRGTRVSQTAMEVGRTTATQQWTHTCGAWRAPHHLCCAASRSSLTCWSGMWASCARHGTPSG